MIDSNRRISKGKDLKSATFQKICPRRVTYPNMKEIPMVVTGGQRGMGITRGTNTSRLAHTANDTESSRTATNTKPGYADVLW